MRRVTMPAPLRGAKTILFLLAVITLSTFLTMYDSRPTKAEGLLYTVGCTVSRLLSYECAKTTPPPSESPNENPTQPTSPAPAEAPAPSTTETGGTMAPVSPAPVSLDQELLSELPKVSETTGVQADQESGISAYAFPAGYITTDQAAFGAASAQPIRASETGWMILGVSWVWWASGAFVLAGVAYLMRQLLAKHFLSIAS